MKNSWKKVVAMMIAAALCVSCGVTGFSEDIQTEENTEIVEAVEAQNQEEPQQEEAPAQEPAPAPEPVQAPEPVKEPDPAPVQEPEPVKEPEPAPEAPKAEPEPVKEPEPAPKAEEPKAEPAPEAPKAEEPKKEEETKADEKTEENIEETTEVPAQKIEESAEQKKEDIKADEAKKEEETKAETQIEESKEESKTDEPKAEESEEESKAEEKSAEQPTVPAATKVEPTVEDAPAADDVVVKENITVRIEWEDEDNALGLRPQTRAVTLNGSDGQTYSATLSEKDGWQHTFADLTTQRGAEVIYYSVDADDVTDYDKDVRGLTVTYTCTAKPVAEEEPVIDEQPVAEDENLIDDQMDGEQGELPEGDLPTVTETEDGTVIDMGETAEEPVEGEEANADKIEEDGELDEDFILPEEGELPEEDAEPEIPEIDFSTLQVVIGEPQYDEDVMTLRATLIGFDNIDYALQWQFSTDDATWTDVPGATGDTLVVQLDESNAGCYWRVSAEVFGWKTLPTEQAAQE